MPVTVVGDDRPVPVSLLKEFKNNSGTAILSEDFLPPGRAGYRIAENNCYDNYARLRGKRRWPLFAYRKFNNRDDGS